MEEIVTYERLYRILRELGFKPIVNSRKEPMLVDSLSINLGSDYNHVTEMMSQIVTIMDIGSDDFFKKIWIAYPSWTTDLYELVCLYTKTK